MKIRNCRESSRCAGLANRNRSVFPRWVAILVLALSPAACSNEDPLELAKKLQLAGDFKQSIGVLRRAIEQGAVDPELFFVYGVGLAESGNRDAAVWPLRRAMESPDWEVKAALRLGRGAYIQHSWDRAIKSLDRVLELEPEHVVALVLRSRARIESRRDYEGALADAERALEIDPDADGARISQVVSLLALDRAEEAGELIQSIELISREAGPDQPNTARFCGARASFAVESGNSEMADEIYSECLKEFPSAPDLLGEALKFYAAEGRAERTIEILEAAVEAAPNNRDYRIGLAVRLEAQGRGAEATELLRKATEAKNPALAAGAWVDLSGYLLDREEYDEGIKAFDSALEMIPSPSADLTFRYADALILSNRFDKALEVADRFTFSAYSDLIRGRVYLERDDPKLALESFTDSLLVWPDNAVARYYASLAAEGIGDYGRAIEEMRYSIRAGASLTDSRARLARLHMAEGRLSDALEALRHDIVRQPGDVEMAVLAVELGARLALPDQPSGELVRPLRTPEDWRRAILAGIKGTRTRFGSAAAVKLIHSTPDLDLSDPQNASILERLVENMLVAGSTEEALALLDGHLEDQPGVGSFHGIRGWLLAQRDGVGSEQSHEELTTALELEPENVVALIGLGRERHSAGEPDGALAYFEKASDAAPEDPAPLRTAVDMLIAEGRAGEAQIKLERLLELDPYDGVAALRLARIRVELNLDKGRSIALGRLARRFGPKAIRPEASELLARLSGD